MKLTKYHLILLLLCSMSSTGFFAQDSISTQEIPEFKVSEKVEAIFSEVNVQELDSALIANNNTNNLANLLAKNSAVTMRSYGVTGINFISMRGGNANHVAVMWNGFNLQDPLNGGVNFFQSTTNFIDAVDIQYGGSSTAYGSGAVGGVIHLDNKAKYNNAFYGSAVFKAGSFGLNAQHVQVGMGTNRVSSQLRIYRSSTSNDFEFENIAKINSPTERYLFANNEQYGVMHELYYKLRPNQQLSSQIWYQHNFREIPGNMTALRQEGIEENISDDWIRWGLNWNRKGEKVNYEARTGVFYNQSNYVNSVIDLNSSNNSIRSISEFMAVIQLFKKQRLSLGIMNNYTVGLSDNFNNNPSLNSVALYAAPSFKLGKKLVVNTSIREEYYNESLTPLTYSASAKYNLFKGWYTNASVSRNYRNPNFNDLYWNGGGASGNLDLVSEDGYSSDLGLGFKKLNNVVSIHSEVTFYLNNIDNQIQWIPLGQVWTPINISRVETKGVELKTNTQFVFSKNTKLLFNLNYAYTDAQVAEKSENESDEVLGKQLIYIPYYQGNAYAGISIHGILFDINLQYVGYQFTRADNLEWLEGFWLTDLGLAYTFDKTAYKIQLFTKANNIFNQVYQMRQWYPMPLINYEIGINLTFK